MEELSKEWYKEQLRRLRADRRFAIQVPKKIPTNTNKIKKDEWDIDDVW